MRFEGTGIEDKVVDISILNHIMQEAGLVKAEQWDFERVSYDKKIEKLDTNEIFYLRVQGYAVEGNVDSNHAKIKLLTPLLGKHYYPHGVEYGEGENFPKNVVDKSKSILNKVASAIAETAK